MKTPPFDFSVIHAVEDHEFIVVDETSVKVQLEFCNQCGIRYNTLYFGGMYHCQENPRPCSVKGYVSPHGCYCVCDGDDDLDDSALECIFMADEWAVRRREGYEITNGACHLDASTSQAWVHTNFFFSSSSHFVSFDDYLLTMDVRHRYPRDQAGKTVHFQAEDGKHVSKLKITLVMRIDGCNDTFKVVGSPWSIDVTPIADSIHRKFVRMPRTPFVGEVRGQVAAPSGLRQLEFGFLASRLEDPSTFTWSTFTGDVNVTLVSIFSPSMHTKERHFMASNGVERPWMGGID